MDLQEARSTTTAKTEHCTLQSIKTEARAKTRLASPPKLGAVAAEKKANPGIKELELGNRSQILKKKAPRPRSEATTYKSSPSKPDRNMDYMSNSHKDHFRAILTAWKKQLMTEVDRTVSNLKDEMANYPDPADQVPTL